MCKFFRNPQKKFIGLTLLACLFSPLCQAREVDPIYYHKLILASACVISPIATITCYNTQPKQEKTSLEQAYTNEKSKNQHNRRKTKTPKRKEVRPRYFSDVGTEELEKRLNELRKNVNHRKKKTEEIARTLPPAVSMPPDDEEENMSDHLIGDVSQMGDLISSFATLGVSDDDSLPVRELTKEENLHIYLRKPNPQTAFKMEAEPISLILSLINNYQVKNKTGFKYNKQEIKDWLDENDFEFESTISGDIKGYKVIYNISGNKLIIRT